MSILQKFIACVNAAKLSRDGFVWIYFLIEYYWPMLKNLALIMFLKEINFNQNFLKKMKINIKNGALMCIVYHLHLFSKILTFNCDNIANQTYIKKEK